MVIRMRRGRGVAAALGLVVAVVAGCADGPETSPGAPAATAAPFTMTQLEGFRDRITADIPYWRGRGITITAVAPRADGTGIDVLTAGGSAEEQLALAERYPDIPVAVRQETVKIPVASAAPPIELSAPPPSKTIRR